MANSIGPTITQSNPTHKTIVKTIQIDEIVYEINGNEGEKPSKDEQQSEDEAESKAN